MQAIVAVVSCTLLFVVLWDAFEGIVLPRRVTRRLRLTRLFYRYTWLPWSAAGRRMRPGKRRERYLSYYGPLSMLLLLSVWAASLIVGFAMLQWAFGSAMNAPEGAATFGTDLYVRGTTFFTLGLGDVVPRTPLARALTVVEAGTGFGVLALVIGYLPVLYQAFSQREVSISLLDARAGSPPSATELLRRHSQGHMEELRQLLRDWERWAAEVLESHLSYPVLGYYRSQHDNQSWLAALTTILDASALVIVGIDAGPARQALLTFAMARHAVVDLAQIFNTPPGFPGIAGVVIGANCILVLYNAIRWVSLPHLFFALGRGKRGTFAKRIFCVTENRGVGSRRAITCSRLETDREWRERRVEQRA